MQLIRKKNDVNIFVIAGCIFEYSNMFECHH